MDVKVPDIGDFKDVPVIEVLVKPGDQIAAEAPLVTLESDKATMEVPSPAAGVVREVAVKVGDKVSEGSLIARLDAKERESRSGAKPQEPATPEQPVAASRAVTPPAAHPDGAAPGGLALAARPEVDFAKFGPIDTKPLTRIQKIAGPGLHRNWVPIPHVTNHEDADITDLEAFRLALNKEQEVKVPLLAFLMKACVAALQKFPNFNSSLEGDHLVVKKYWNIGFAADTPQGLVVPVLKDADKKGVLAIAKETAELAAKARDGKLSPGDMQGSTFTISSLGGIGGTYFTPIINAPEVAILGASRAQMRPVWSGSDFKPRLMLPLSLSWDHRVVDGAGAARFNTFLAGLLGDARRMLL